MDYAVHTMPSYQHMQGKENKAHEGSKSMGHSNNSVRYSTHGGVGSGKATKNPIDDDR